MKKRLVSILLVLAFVFTSLLPMMNVSAAVSEDGTSYTVEKGDNLYRIGKNLKKDWEDIAELNGIKEPYTIYIGQILKLAEETAKAEEAKEENVTEPSKETEVPSQTEETEQVKHGEIPFDEIVYKRPDFEKYQKEIQAVQTMVTNKEDADKILAAYDEAGNCFLEIATELRYASIRSYLDVTDTYYATEVAYVTQGYTVLQNQFMNLAESILASEIGAYAEEIWGEEEMLAIERAKKLIDENTIELAGKEQELVSAYINATATVTIDVKGTKMTLNEMFSQPGLTYEEQVSYYYEYIDALNAVAGEIYLELVDIRNQIAQVLGFESYTEYSYFNYDRDYTAKDATKLHEYVKDYIVPIYISLVATLTNEDITTINSTGGDITAFDSVYRMLFDEVSPDLTEAYEYMLKYKLYDFSISPVKANLSYTSFLYNYHQPYMNIAATGMYTDVSTFVHEFGHYNAFFKHDTELEINLDIAEIHSQGLEMLFTPYYAVYQEAEKSIVKYNFLIYLQTLIQGCLEDEFQQYVYSHDITTVKELNEIYYSLQEDYGMATESDVKESTSWVLITHTFAMPLYYISYATSLVPALEIFELSTTDREKAIGVYNALVGQGSKETFLNTLKTAGLGSPFYEGTICKISEAIGEYFDLFEEAELDPAA